MIDTLQQPYDLFFGDLQRATFVRRVSRFSAIIALDNREIVARIRNTGRLRDALYEGADVFVSKSQGTKTGYYLAASRLQSGILACVDAQVCSKVLAEALRSERVPSLRGYRVIKFEFVLRTGRADLLLEDTEGRKRPCECKSVTLVRKGAALFPDAPSERGRRHARHLALEQGILVFVVLRSDAQELKINEPTDPLFAYAVRKALDRIKVVAISCQVDPLGVKVLREIPVRWFSKSAVFEPIEDVVAEGMRLLFVGMNPGLYSAWYGMYFAHPRNIFWRALRRSGLVKESVGPGDEFYILRRYGIGFTDLVKRPTASWDEVTEAEKKEGVRILLEKISRLKPKNVCFVGIESARAVLGTAAKIGPWPKMLLGSKVFIVPHTSPRQKAYDCFKYFRALSDFLRETGYLL